MAATRTDRDHPERGAERGAEPSPAEVHEDPDTRAQAPTEDAPVLPRRPLPGRLVYVVAAVTAAIWILLDQATKALALEHVPPGGVGDGGVRLRLVFNEHAAFGIPGFPGMFLIITVVVVVLVARALPRTDRLSLALAYGLVTGGALGNALDRLFRPPGFPSGAVVDFVDIGVGGLRWPTFNVADIGIVVGAVAIGVLMLVLDREQRAHEARRREHRSVRPDHTGPQG